MFEWIDNTLSSILFGASKKKNMLRNLLLECSYNLAILDLLRDDLEQDDSIFLEIFRKLENKQLQEFAKVIHIEESIAAALVNNALDDIDESNYQKDLISNILVRIHVLNVIGQLHNTRGLRNIQYKTRAQNLKKKISELKEYLSNTL
jgi:DUF1009 family protein